MGTLIAAYIFGSVARGDADLTSDLDLLAIVEDGAGMVAEEEVVALVPAELGHLVPSISWYGVQRLEAMFGAGDLFAWHLSEEAIPLFETQRILATLGRPSAYRECVPDIESFWEVLGGIPDELLRHPNNAVYELGLVYVCVRNIAMAASSVLCRRPNFSRYSPYEPMGVADFPLPRERYDVAMACRMAGQRGTEVPSCIPARGVIGDCAALDGWLDSVLDAVRR